MLFIRIICIYVAFICIVMHIRTRSYDTHAPLIYDYINKHHVIYEQSSNIIENLKLHPLSRYMNNNICIPSMNSIFQDRDLSQLYVDSKPYSFIQNDVDSVHASSLVSLPTGLMVLYFGGTREGAGDVKIYKSILNNYASSWSKPSVILTREMLSNYTGKYIKKLGNPVAFSDMNGRVHVFIVGVSLGGWATSRIYQFYFDSDLEHLHYVRELHLGAFANFSHLVRNPPMLLKSGGGGGLYIAHIS